MIGEAYKHPVQTSGFCLTPAFKKISEVRNKYFKNSEPVSTLVQVSKLVKPECKVEIEVIAIRSKWLDEEQLFSTT